MVARLQRHQHRAPDNFLKLIFNIQWKGFTLYVQYKKKKHLLWDDGTGSANMLTRFRVFAYKVTS